MPGGELFVLLINSCTPVWAKTALPEDPLPFLRSGMIEERMKTTCCKDTLHIFFFINHALQNVAAHGFTSHFFLCVSFFLLFRQPSQCWVGVDTSFSISCLKAEREWGGKKREKPMSMALDHFFKQWTGLGCHRATGLNMPKVMGNRFWYNKMS